MAKVKTFVLDTNVLLHDPRSVESFEENTVILPMAVMEELDKFKAHNDELGRNARQVIRRIDELRAAGNLRDGVPLKGGGSLRILTSKIVADDPELDREVPDNRILRVAYRLHQEGHTVVFVSKDINARLKADALGITAEDFENQKVNFDELYSGCTEVVLPHETLDKFERSDLLDQEGLGRYPNEFVVMTDDINERHVVVGRVQKPGFIRHLKPENSHVWNLEPRNNEQAMALELLMDPNVQIVTLVGQAGTGKTLLALAAGLENTLRARMFDRILVSRPIIPMGKDIGYLPGAKEEKLSHWMQPIFDNLTYLLRDSPVEEEPHHESGGNKKGNRKPKSTAQERIDRMFRDHVMELEALTYIRGRSIPNQFVIVDEAQNLTPHEVKTILSRAGEGSKMVLTGDPYQIDNPYLDASSNGLTYAAERLKEQKIHGHVTLRKSERSLLAAIAAECL